MDYYKHQAIGTHSYLITEIFPGDKGGHSIGLFVGTHRACVVDTGWGVTGNLRQYISQITDLPVICILTHPHPDHAGAAVHFDEIYMNSLDASIVPWALAREKRLRDAGHRHETDQKLLAEMEREISDCSNFSWNDMHDGQRFDLGDVTVEAIAIPGHTQGSMVLYCAEEDILCTGDSVGQTVSLIGEGGELPITLAEYRSALERLAALMTAETKLITGHSVQLQEVQLLQDLLALCIKAEAGKAAPPAPDLQLPAFAKRSKFSFSVASENGLVLLYPELTTPLLEHSDLSAPLI